MTNRNGFRPGDKRQSRELPPIGAYVKDEYARQFQVQPGAGDPLHKNGRGRLFWPGLLALCLIAGGLVLGFHRHLGADRDFFATAREFTSRAFELVKFPVEQVHIVGHKFTKEQSIVNKLGPVWDQSLLSLNSSIAQRRIETLPWVKEAIVERVFPQGLNVFITERRPIGRWVTLKGRFVFDDEGVVISQIKVGQHLKLPIYEGKGAPEVGQALQGILANFEDLSPYFKRYHWVDQRRWTLILKDGMKVLLPESEVSRGLSRLRALQVQYNILGRDLAFIDLRLHDRVTIRPKRSQKIKVLSTLEDLEQTGKIESDSLFVGEDGI